MATSRGNAVTGACTLVVAKTEMSVNILREISYVVILPLLLNTINVLCFGIQKICIVLARDFVITQGTKKTGWALDPVCTSHNDHAMACKAHWVPSCHCFVDGAQTKTSSKKASWWGS